MTFKQSLMAFFARARDRPTKKNLEEALEASKASLAYLTHIIESQNTIIAKMTNEATEANIKEKAMTNVTSNNANTTTPNDTIDVPVDLGHGYIVTIKGLPGRPSVAACERLCKVLMAYAVEPVVPIASQPKVQPESQQVPKVPLINPRKATASTKSEEAALEEALSKDFLNAN